jgi:predicted transglutaminase-like cysteine proteinase
MQNNCAQIDHEKKPGGLLVVSQLRSACAVLAALFVLAPFTAAFGNGTDTPPFASVGENTPMPIGWVQFCQTYEAVCDTQPSTPRDIVLNQKAWADLLRINNWVNHNIQPMTDTDHYGMIQWWRYPDDGIGACHSYALLKRRLLMEAGWPREALLMTIVWLDHGRGEGHAVITVKTDRGEFILDNLTDDVQLWSKTPYYYYKRQSQSDPNGWVRINDRRASVAVSAVQSRIAR